MAARSGCWLPASVESSPPSSDADAGKPNFSRYRKAWYGCRLALNMSKTCGPTSLRPLIACSELAKKAVSVTLRLGRARHQRRDHLGRRQLGGNDSSHVLNDRHFNLMFGSKFGDRRTRLHALSDLPG